MKYDKSKLEKQIFRDRGTRTKGKNKAIVSSEISLV
jgi:hypothetical protein